MTHAVVLGHTGFVGRAITAELEHQGFAVTGHSSATLDLREPDHLRRLDGVLTPDSILFHLSALTAERGLTLDVLQANLAMTLNLARYLESHPVRKVIYLSSDAVYPMVDGPVTESIPVIDTLPRYAATSLFWSSDRPVMCVNSIAAQDNNAASSSEASVPSSAALVRRLTPWAR